MVVAKVEANDDLDALDALESEEKEFMKVIEVVRHRLPDMC